MAGIKAGYDHTGLERDMDYLNSAYPFLETGTAGKSFQGRAIYYLRIGNGPSNVFYNGAHHSNEWITSMLLMQFVRNFMRCYTGGLRMRGYDTVNIFERCSIYIIPMVNPDGVDFVINGTEGILCGSYAGKHALPDRNAWKANIRGVDLNLNYPAGWDKAKEYETRFDATGPSPSRHAGTEPLSEPETQAVAEFTRINGFKLAIAYHTQGMEIYWRYRDFDPLGARTIGDLFASTSGYTLSETVPEDSYAGFKDWFIQEFNYPGYTIEAGYGRNPLPLSQFPSIYEDNEEIMLMAPLLSLGLR